jgi:hypothetical protein
MHDVEALFVALTPATLLLIKGQLVAYKSELNVNDMELTRAGNTVIALDGICADKINQDLRCTVIA